MKLATFNLYQFAAPPYYWYELSSSNRYSDQSWNDKKQWIKDQLRLLDADVVGFQEIFDEAALQAVVDGPVLTMSGVSQEGLTNVLRAVRAEITEDRIRLKKADEEPEAWHP